MNIGGLIDGRTSTASTLILGRAVLLVVSLMGCHSASAPSSLDAGSTDVFDAAEAALDRPALDVVAPSDVVSEDVARRTDVSRYDAGPDVLIRFDSLGPGRQMRHVCPPVSDGDPRIPAPRLIYPLSGTRATSRRPGFRWELAPGTTGARVEICADPCCARVITTYDVDGTSQRPEEKLPPGVVWWRTRGRTEAGYGRDTSFTWEVQIKRRDSPVDTAWGTIRDVDGDGYDDFFTSARVGRRGFSSPPTFYLIRGGDRNLRVDPRNSWMEGRNSDRDLLRSGDCDGDGRLDVLTADRNFDEHGYRIQQHSWNTSAGGLVIVAQYEPVADCTSDVDLNGDGFHDLACSRCTVDSDHQVQCLNNFVVYGAVEPGLGGVSRIQIEMLPGRSSFDRTRIFLRSVGDLNGDGYGDLLALGTFVNRVWIMPGGPAGPDVRTAVELQDEAFWGGAQPTSGFVGDLNGDQLVDFALSLRSSRRMRVYLGDRSRLAVYDSQIRNPNDSFEETQRFPNFGQAAGVGSDSDGDGLAEILIGCHDCRPNNERPGGAVFAYQWVHPGVTELIRTVEYGDMGFSAASLGDMDGDGYDDVGSGMETTVVTLFGGDDGIRLSRSAEIHVPLAEGQTAVGFGYSLALRHGRLTWRL